jgi:Cu(I)/Ag(I) efflux system membrane fusion protein
MKRPQFIIIAIVLLVAGFLAGRFFQNHPAGTETAESPPVAAAGQKADMGAAEEEPGDLPPGAVHISPSRQQLIGVRTGRVEKQALNHTFRLLGRVAPDETRTYVINATVDGWITRTLPNTTGSFVRKNEVLAGFYSPVFLSAVHSLLYALNAIDRSKSAEMTALTPKDQPPQFNLNLQQNIDSLKNFGMGDLQIQRIIASRQWDQNVEITSPADGIILARNVSDGLRFGRETELYRIADLSRVWILADAYEREVRYFQPGAKATVLLPYQDKTYQARVSSVPPVFDSTTRTLKVRLETDNPGFALRPDMFVDVALPVTLPPALTVPADSILFSGLRKTVFIDRGRGIFEPRTVETGWRLGDRIEITSGLESGETIVLSGNFLIDSESRLQAVAQGIYGDASLDPVCGMNVDEAKAAAGGMTSVFRGKTYYFCSPECKEKFDKDPASFVEKSAKKDEMKDLRSPAESRP